MPEAWGGAKKVYTSSKQKYDQLHERFQDDFPTLSSLFHLAASIGIKHGQSNQLAIRDELTNVYSIDSDLFEPIIAVLHPDLQHHERLEKLMVRIIASEIAGRRIDPEPADIIRTVGVRKGN